MTFLSPVSGDRAAGRKSWTASSISIAAHLLVAAVLVNPLYVACLEVPVLPPPRAFIHIVNPPPPEPPAPQPPELPLFESETQLTLPAPDQKPVEPKNILIQCESDLRQQIPAVLRRSEGGWVAFGRREDLPKVSFVFLASTGERLFADSPQISLKGRLAFELEDKESWASIRALSAENGIPPDMFAYAVFPYVFKALILNEAQRFAEDAHQSGRLSEVVIGFDARSELGFLVKRVATFPAARQAE